MTGVIYARYSSENQREESIEGQIRECMEYAEKKGLTIISTYIDRALSARTDNRPEFQKMIKDSEKGLFDVVLVWKLDRFARDRYDSAHYKHILKKCGVKVISAKENISDGPEGIILESMLEGMAEYYSAELSVKIQRGQTDNSLKCKFNGGSLPLGYKVDNDQNYQLDPFLAPIIQEIFYRYADGESVVSISQDLNNRNIKTIRGNKLSFNSINSIICNRSYIGEYHYRDVITPDGIPSIIDSELFERAQKRLNKNKRAPGRAKAKENYILTTKLFCGHCGAFMVGESGKSRNGIMHHYYKCASVKKNLGTCNKKALRKDYIEDYVVMKTKQKVLIDEVINKLADEMIEYSKRTDPTIPLLKIQLQETEKSIENMLNAIQQGIITASTKERLEVLEEQKESIKMSIIKEEMNKSPVDKEHIVLWMNSFKNGDINDISYRQALIDNFVNAVYVFDDHIKVIYNYENGTDTITLTEIEEAFSGSDLNSFAPPKTKALYSQWIQGFYCYSR